MKTTDKVSLIVAVDSIAVTIAVSLFPEELRNWIRPKSTTPTQTVAVQKVDAVAPQGPAVGKHKNTERVARPITKDETGRHSGVAKGKKPDGVTAGNPAGSKGPDSGSEDMRSDGMAPPASTEDIEKDAPIDDLSGLWSATYPGGPLKVRIRQIKKRVVAQLITGNGYVPPGELTIKGTYNASPFQAEQICAGGGFSNSHWVSAKMIVVDGDSMTEECDCGGCPVQWHRIKQ